MKLTAIGFVLGLGMACALPATAQEAAPAATAPAPDVAAAAEDAAPAPDAAAEGENAAAPAPDAAAAADTQATSTAEPASSAALPNLQPAVTADGCELHIWPAERMRSMTTGWLSGFGALGALADGASHAKGDASRQVLLSTALDSPTQLELLTSLDLRGMLNLTPGTVIVIHDTPLDRHTMNKIKTRRAESGSKCYSELIVADVFYQKAAIYGRSLKTLFMVREFGADQSIDRQYKAWGGNGLKLFPPKEGEDVTASLDELKSVFKANFDEYANNARKALDASSPRT